MENKHTHTDTNTYTHESTTGRGCMCAGGSVGGGDGSRDSQQYEITSSVLTHTKNMMKMSKKNNNNIRTLCLEILTGTHTHYTVSCES